MSAIKLKNLSGINKSTYLGEELKVRNYLFDGIDVNTRSESLLTPLHIAAQKNHKEICNLLIDNGADLYAVDSHGNNALHIAAKSGRSEIVKLLLSRGMDVDVINRTGKTPLYFSVKYNHIESTDVLFSNGANITTDDDYKTSPLSILLGSYHFDLLRYFLNHFNNKVDRKIIEEKEYGVLKKLIAHEDKLISHRNLRRIKKENREWKPSKNVRKREYDIYEFIRNEDHKNINQLVELGLDFNLMLNRAGQNHMNSEQHGITGTGFSRTYYYPEDIGVTPLQYSLLNPYSSIPEQLIRNGADVNALDYNGNSPLHFVLMYGSKGSVKHDQIYDLTEIMKRFYPNLHRYLNRHELPSRLKNVELLIQFGANVNVQNYSGSTPLEYAILSNQIDVCKLLIKHGANIDAFKKYYSSGDCDIRNQKILNLKNNYRESVLNWCKSEGMEEMFELLSKI